ncbi:MAG: hypothetical protein K6C36_09595 [Clostridia bacterium]|nr:hypothetical protein [Clostridia bacterium]
MKKLVAILLVFAMMFGTGAIVSGAADTDAEAGEAEEVDKNVYPRTKFQLIVAIMVRLVDIIIKLIKGESVSFDLGAVGGFFA